VQYIYTINNNMATNKHALIRYRVIDRCLRHVDQQWNWQTLADACAEEIEQIMDEHLSLSERTIKGDLRSMRTDKALGYFAPIEYDRKEKSYYYSKRDYSITESPINKSDRNQLNQMISLMRQFTGFTYLQGIGNIIQKMELLVFESLKKEKQHVHLDQPATIPGQEWLDQIYKAVDSEQTLKINYQAFGKKAYEAIISPYLLKEYNHRWYLYAYNHEKKGMRTYGLERIHYIKDAITDYIPNSFFDPSDYFDDLIGVSLDPKSKKVKIKFEVGSGSINYIKTQAIHQSQKIIREDDQSAVFQIEVFPNYELESTFLSFGETIKVLSPASVVKSISKRVKQMNLLYLK